MLHTTMVNLIILLVLIPVGVLSAWATLRGLDKLNGMVFKRDIGPGIRDSSSVGVYYGLRFFGVCYLIGQLASRFV